MFYYNQPNDIGAFKGSPACRKILSGLVATITVEPNYNNSPLKSVTTQNVYKELYALMSKYNQGNINEFLKLLTEQSVLVNPSAGIQITLPNLYSNTIPLSESNLKNCSDALAIVEAQRKLDMLQAPIYNFRKQLHTKHGKKDVNSITLDSNMGSDDSSSNTEIITSIDYTKNIASLADAKQIFKFLFKSFWLVCTVYNGKPCTNAEEMSNDMYSLLASKWTSDTYRWYKLSSENESSLSNQYTSYFNIYEDTVTYGTLLTEGDITNIVKRAAHKATGEKALRIGLDKAFVLYKDDKELQEPQFRYLIGNNNNNLWARYLFMLLNSACDVPFFNSSNPENYSAEDIIDQICPDNRQSNPDALSCQIPIKYLAPDYIDNFTTFDEWVESLKEEELSDYNLSSYTPNYVNIPNIKIRNIEETISQSYQTHSLIVDSNSDKSITELYDRIYLLGSLNKLSKGLNVETPYEYLFGELYNKMFVKQFIPITGTRSSVPSPTTNVDHEAQRYYRAFAGNIFADVSNALQNFESNYNRDRKANLLKGYYLSGVDYEGKEWAPLIEKCIVEAKAKYIRLYKNDFINLYKLNHVNSIYNTRPHLLEEKLKRHIGFNGPANCLAILKDPITVDIDYIFESEKEAHKMVFLPNYTCALINANDNAGSTVRIIHPNSVNYDSETSRYYTSDEEFIIPK